jgi:hypothetical protein
MNYLEQLLSEWYQYDGYLVRQNIKVSKREKGGYDGELDIVAFNPTTKHLVHLEPSMDTYSWKKREDRYAKKFAHGRNHIASIFKGLTLPRKIDQRAVFVYASKKSRTTIGGGKIYLLSEVLDDIKQKLCNKSIETDIVPESYPLIRTIQFMVQSEVKLKSKGKGLM